MGFNLSERYLTALNLLLIIGLAYFAALSVNDIISGRLAGEIKVAPPPHVAALAPPQTYPRSHYDEIVNRDVFTPPAEQQPAPAAEDLRLKLLGTSQMTKDKPYAIIEDERNMRQSLYQLDEDIPDVGKLVEIDADKVFIERNGQRVSLEIPAGPLPAPPPSGLVGRVTPPGHSDAGIGGGIQRMNSNRFVLDRSLVNNKMQNMMSLLTQMRALPEMEDGRPRGFKLSEIQSGSVFQQLGLMDGDVVISVGGQPLTDPTAAMQLLSELRNQSVVSLTVMRNGRPVQFQYDIR